MNKTLNLILLFGFLTTIFLAACAGPITIDIGGSGGNDGGGTGDGNSTVSSQTFFILMIVLLVAIFAMVLVAMSR